MVAACVGLPLSILGRGRPCGRRENERGFGGRPVDAASFTGARVSEARVKYGAGSLPECRTVALSTFTRLVCCCWALRAAMLG
jgi:hypothetical protein